jgi:hypothetical protein
MPSPARPPTPRRLPIALPSAHFMAFAPLDAWARVLRRAKVRISPRYWPRLAWCLFTSSIATVATLPERVALAPILAAAYRRSRSAQAAPPTLVILGYYRSGTTHLHYLLSCDPRFITPKWYQTLAPTGFLLSWEALRWLMTPFVSSTRPQDDVAIGPEWPAEDDFAVNNWTGACTMPGRMLLPSAWERFAGLNDIAHAPEADRAAFGRALHGFCWKIRRLARGEASRILLLKTPAHTARMGELVRLFGGTATCSGAVKFIHLSRDPGAVLRSNVAMHSRFGSYFLEDYPGDEVIRERIIAEYDATERAFLRDAAALPAGTLSRVRYQDLIADPLGEIRRVYAELGLALTPEVEARFSAYLHTVSDYRAASDKPKPAAGDSSTPRGTAHGDSLPEQLAWMAAAFGHDKPAAAKVPLPPVVRDIEPRTPGVWLVAPVMIAVLIGAAWLALAAAFRDRFDWLIWPAGIAIGLAALRAARGGTWTLGVWAAAVTLCTHLAVAYPATYLSSNDYWLRDPIAWRDIWDSTRDGLLAINNFVWTVLGVGTAYRFASRKHVRPPGM